MDLGEKSSDVESQECRIVEAEAVLDIKVLKILGKGIYKTTYLADHKGKHFALKRIELSERGVEKLRKRNLTVDDLFDKELSASPLWFPPHPNINPIFRTESRNPSRPLLVEKLYENTLEEFEEIWPGLSYSEKAEKHGDMGGHITTFILFLIGMGIMNRVAEMARGIGLCHHYGLIHGDIKPSNIGIIRYEKLPQPNITCLPGVPEFGIKPTYIVKPNPDNKPYKVPTAVISDFGISSFIAETEGFEKVRDNIGSTYTRDPILFEKGSLPSKLSDVWSLTAVMYWMLTGKYPFSEEKEDYTLIETKQKYERRVRESICKDKVNEALGENMEREILDDEYDLKKKLVQILSRGFRLVDNYYKNAIQMGQDVEAKFPYNDEFYNPVPTDYASLFSS